MFPYWLLFSLFAAGAVQYYRDHRALAAGGRSAPLLGVFALVAVAMVGFRYETGGDWEPYLEIYQNISYFNFWTAIGLDDPGYSFLNWLSNQLGLDIWAVNLVCASVFCWGLTLFCKQQPNPWLAFVVAIPYLVIVVAMGYSRQAVAIGLIMAAIVSWDQSRFVRFGCLILLAVTFHRTAVIAVPLIALSATKNRFVTGGTLLVFGWGLYSYFLSEDVDRFMTVYVEAGYESEGAAIRVAMNLVPALIFLAWRDRFGLTDSQKRMWVYFSLAAVGTLGLLAALPSSTAVDRIALYLIPIQLFVLSRLPQAFPDKNRTNAQLTMVVILYSAAIQFVWLNFANHAQYWVPYKFWPFFA